MKKIFIAFTIGLFAFHSVFAADRPNDLFIAVDDLRPELGCYDNTIVKTPNIDRIAARGIVFNKAYCQQAVCRCSKGRSDPSGIRKDPAAAVNLTISVSRVGVVHVFVRKSTLSGRSGRIRQPWGQEA